LELTDNAVGFVCYDKAYGFVDLFHGVTPSLVGGYGLAETMLNCLSRLSHVCWANARSGISVRRMNDVPRHAPLGIKKIVNINTPSLVYCNRFDRKQNRLATSPAWLVL
jgi:hypothetical protein